VIDSDEINAFALPGGFFYVNSGLILHAMEESELAGLWPTKFPTSPRGMAPRTHQGRIDAARHHPLILLGPGGWAGYGIYQGLNLRSP